MGTDEIRAKGLKAVRPKKSETKEEYCERIRKAKDYNKSCFAVSTQKGGVGKTTCTSNIAYVLAQRGFKVLVIDSDSQGSLTGLCNELPLDFDATVEGLSELYELYEKCRLDGKLMPKEEIDKYIRHPKYCKRKSVRGENGKFELQESEEYFGFDLIAADITLGNIELGLAGAGGSAGYYLLNIINRIKTLYDYDYIIIDLQPSMSLISYNALASATAGVIIPVNLDVMTLRGAKNLIKTVAEIQESLDDHAILHKGILGIVMNEFIERSKVQNEYKGRLDMYWPLKKFETTIPSRAACNQAHFEGLLFSQKSKEANKVFNQLVDEIIFEEIRRKDEKTNIIHKNFGSAYKESIEGNQYVEILVNDDEEEQ